MDKTPVFKSEVFDRYLMREDGTLWTSAGDAVQPSRAEYPSVVLTKSDMRRVRVPIHRLVCWTFHGPPPFEGAVVRHLNDQRQDWHPENLSWGSYRENAIDRHLNASNSNYAPVVHMSGHNIRVRKSFHIALRECLTSYGFDTRAGTHGIQPAIYFIYDRRAYVAWTHDRKNHALVRMMIQSLDLRSADIDVYTWRWLNRTLRVVVSDRPDCDLSFTITTDDLSSTRAKRCVLDFIEIQTSS